MKTTNNDRETRLKSQIEEAKRMLNSLLGPAVISEINRAKREQAEKLSGQVRRHLS